MATGQYLTEVAVRLVERGHQVTVVTSRRAYDHPETRFPKSETWRGIRIIRIGSTSFGKGAKWRRAADFGSFIAACCWRLAWLPRHDAVVALTTPPLISFIGAWLARLWGAAFFYWVMDFNPDEAIAAGWLRAESISARLLERMSRFSLRRAKKVIALDRFMRDRIVAKGITAANVAVIPPWSHDADVKFDLEGRERFRKAHGLDGKFVVMYSGNHSPVHPLDTLLQAAERMRSDQGVVFCFVGGGSEWRKIKEKAEGGGGKAEMLKSETQEAEDGGRRTEGGRQQAEGRRQKAESEAQGAEAGAVCSHLSVSAFERFSFSNVTCLPYQPLDQLSGSLSAADLQVVVMGDLFVGLVHPCKIYNAMAVGAPVLYIGPRLSHVTEISSAANGEVLCFSADHGEVEVVVKQIQRARDEAQQRSRHCLLLAHSPFSKESVLPKLITELESA